VILVAATGDAVARLEGGGDGFRVSLSLEGSGAQCLAVADGAIYAGGRGSGLWRSDDGGAIWRDLRLPQPDVFSVAVSPADGAVYAGCEPSMLFRSDDGGQSWRELEALRSIPSAPNWSFPPRPWTSHVRWIAPSPHEPGLILVGIELGGLMWSDDGGETWQDHRPGAKLDVHSLAWHPTQSGRAYETGGDGTAWSRDGGRSWQPVDQGRDRNYSWALAVDPSDPDTWFASVSPGPFAAHSPGRADAYLYRWDDGGPWQALAGPFSSMPYALRFGDGVLYAGFSDGNMLASADRGASWRDVPLSGDSLARIVALTTLD
jgi:photosystem II stability/assembly factor-like uncharacterized protein